jgi:hypothetical protein
MLFNAPTPIIPSEVCLQAVIALSTSATALPTTPLAGRQELVIQNLDSSIVIYVGSSTVTNSGATRGIKLTAGQSMVVAAGPGCAVYAVAASGTPDCAILELAHAV